MSAGEGRTRFIVNLARVDAIDSYGIGELTRCYSVVRQAGGELKLACVSARVLEALHISHLDTVFDIHPQEEAAIRAF